MRVCACVCVRYLALLGGEVAQVSGRAVQVGAALAGVAPGHAHGGAAQLLGAHHALQRARAQRAARVRVARPCTHTAHTHTITLFLLTYSLLVRFDNALFNVML